MADACVPTDSSRDVPREFASAPEGFVVRHRRRLVVLVSLVSFATCLDRACADSTVGVALNHPVYRLIDRFEARGWLRHWGNGTRPISRLEAARALRQIVDRSAKEGGLTRTEAGLVQRMKAEFGPELRTIGVPVAAPAGTLGGRLAEGGPLGFWESAEGYASLDPLFRQALFASGGEWVSQTHVGAIVEGAAGRLIGFRLRHWEARQQGSRILLSRSDIRGNRAEFLEVKGRSADFREATAQMVLGTPWFDLTTGKGFFSWGPDMTGSLFLSDGAPSFPFVTLRARYGRVKFVHLIGFLRSGLLDSARTLRDNGSLRTFERRKYLTAHRLEVGATGRLTVAVQEMVIYGDRGVEFAYATPATVLLAAQSYLGDRDNVAVGVDVDYRAVRNLKVYGALFLDDLVKFQGSGAFSNKFAVKAGAFWVDPLGLRDTEVRGEFVHVEPWVYTHLYDINRYQNYGKVLGHPLGPNSDGIYLEITHRPTKALSLTVSCGRERHGDNPGGPDGSVRNIGGSPDLGQRPGDSVESKQFLAGVRETRTGIVGALRMEPAPDLFLEAGYHLQRSVREGTTRTRGEGTLAVSFNFY